MDDFRLAILGHALIEAKMTRAISKSFLGEAPPEITSLPFPHSARSLYCFDHAPRPFVRVIKAVAKLRYDFAHGKLSELTRKEVQSLVDLSKAATSHFDEIIQTSPRETSLEVGLIVADASVETAAGVADAKREMERKAVSFQENVRKMLAESRPVP
jgi:hypothetical protein